MANKHDIFHKPTVSQIKKGKTPVKVSKDIIQATLSINPEKEYLVIDMNLIPYEFWYTQPNERGSLIRRTSANMKFMKHGNEIRFPNNYGDSSTIDAFTQAMIRDGKVPMDVRAEQFDSTSGPYCSWSFQPIVGHDKRVRKVPLIEVAEAAKLYAYAFRQGAPIIVNPFADEGNVEFDGGEVVVNVPSRTPKRKRYDDIKIMGVPVKDNDRKYVLASTIISDHKCKDMTYKIRKKWVDKKQNSRVFNWDAHDISAWYALVDHFWNNEHNMIPLAMSQIPLPSQKLANIYDIARYNTVIETRESPEQEKRKLYPLNNAELEVILQDAVQKLTHNETLFSDSNRDGNLRDYKWRGM